MDPMGRWLTRTSTWEMLPTTFRWLSRTGKEVIPSLCISSNASLRGLSPLRRACQSPFSLADGRQGNALDSKDVV